MQLKIQSAFINGHLSDEATARYAGALTGDNLDELPEAMLSHVEECAACKDKILEVSLFVNSAAAPAPVKEPEELTIIRMPRPEKIRVRHVATRTAAVFMTGALLMGFYFLFYKDGAPMKDILFPEPAPIKTPLTENAPNRKAEPSSPKALVLPERKTTPLVKPQDAPDPAFRANPALERMIGAPFRSAVVQSVIPPDGVVFSGNILFQWKYAGGDSLTLKIIDNKNTVRYSYVTEKNSLGMSDPLTPGVYYWKLENKTDLLYTGKFFVRKE